MTDRPIIYSSEQGRSFDFAALAKYAMLALAWEAQDLLGQSITVVGGISATSVNTLAISFSAGRIYQLAAADANAYGGGVLAADNTQVMQQGWAPAQSLTLSTSGLSAGQSRWVLVEAGFSQTDAIAPNDPNNGILPYFNATAPLTPLIGPGGNGQAQSTVRQGLCVVKLVYGNPATTGSEVPPQPDSGYVPLYLIDLAFGQTSVSQGQILVAGPSVGTGVPSNYPQAPFLAGLLNSHHGGTPGQAPKINLATEVTGLLPATSILNVRVQLTQDTTFYVNSVSGNDTNPGTSGAPWATLQKADSYLRTIDLNGHTITISCSGTFSSGLTVNGAYVGSSGASSVIYTFTSGSSITVSTGNCILGQSGAAFSITGPVTLSATQVAPGQGQAIYSTSGATLLVSGGPIFTNCGGAHLGNVLATLIINGNYTINGGAQYHAFAINGGLIELATNNQAMTVSISGTPNFSSSFAGATTTANLYFPSAYVTFSGAATGQRYNATLNGIVYTVNGGPNYLPGSIAGSTASGGQYA